MRLMAKLYSKNPSKNNRVNMHPKDETVRFLLDFSKALTVLHGDTMKYGVLMN